MRAREVNRKTRLQATEASMFGGWLRKVIRRLTVRMDRFTNTDGNLVRMDDYGDFEELYVHLLTKDNQIWFLAKGE